MCLQASHIAPYIMYSFAMPISLEVSPALLPASNTASTCAFLTSVYCLNVLARIVESVEFSSLALRLWMSKIDNASVSSKDCETPWPEDEGNAARRQRYLVSIPFV